MSRNFEEEAVFIRTLAEEVIRDCAYEKVIVPFDLAVYLVDLKLLQLSKTISSLSDDEGLTETVVEQCVNNLKGNFSWVKTLRLQVFWREKYRSRDEMKKIHHETVFKNVFPLMTELLEGSLIKTVDKEDLYRKIVIFIILFAGLGSPTQQLIIKETQAALYSIFKNTEIENFLTLSKSTKEQQLIEFARLVTGIRLFNKDCKKGGEGIDDLPLILTQGVKATKERLILFKDQLDKRIDHIAKVLLQVYQSKEVEEDAISIPHNLLKEDLEELKTLLVYFRQLELCLRDLVKDLDDSLIIIEELVERLQTTLLQVHDVVRYRVAIATVQVFPLFLQLSNIWVEMQEEVDILSEVNNIFVELSSNLNLTKPTPLELSLSSDTTAATLSEFEDIKDDCSEFYPGITLCSFSAISDQEYLQYAGFCAWTLAQTEGLLITGNVAIGVLYFENRFYSFSSAEAAYKWGKDPKLHIKSVLSVARAKPELIRLLNVYNELDATEEESEVQEEPGLAKENAEVQTDLHPIASYINKDYTFSEWELKKRALKLATLTRCATKSQQTVKRGGFQKEIGIQATPDKSCSTQTRRDGYCNHPRDPKLCWDLKTLCDKNVPASRFK